MSAQLSVVVVVGINKMKKKGFQFWKDVQNILVRKFEIHKMKFEYLINVLRNIWKKMGNLSLFYVIIIQQWMKPTKKMGW